MKKQLASLGIGLALSVATIFAPSNSFAGHGWHGHGWHGHGWGWGGIGLGLALGGIGIGLGPRYVYGGYPYYDYDYPYYRSYYYGYRPYYGYGYGYRRPYYGTYWGHGRRVARRVNRRGDRSPRRGSIPHWTSVGPRPHLSRHGALLNWGFTMVA